MVKISNPDNGSVADNDHLTATLETSLKDEVDNSPPTPEQSSTLVSN